MYVWYTIGIGISRAFSLNIEYNFHKFEILFDSEFSLELIESSNAVQQTYKLIDYLLKCYLILSALINIPTFIIHGQVQIQFKKNSNHIHHISVYLHLCWALKFDW